jgi:RHS repeat-associated protein
MTASYYYDPFGRRLWKDVAGARTYFHYNDEGLAGEYNGTGNELRTYGYQPGSPWSTNPLFIQVGGEYYWYQNDHLGTPQKMISANGTVVWSARYDSFGLATVDIETVKNNLRFPGQYFDYETGLHYNWHRFYDPETGRYISADPIGMDGGMNLYNYVGGDPVNLTDPEGLQEQTQIRGPIRGPITKAPPLQSPGGRIWAPDRSSLLDLTLWFKKFSDGVANNNEYFRQRSELENQIPCNEQRSATVCFTPPRYVIVFTGDVLFNRTGSTQCLPITLIGRKNCGCDLFNY